MYPEEYQDFAKIVKTYVELSLLMRILPYDMNIMNSSSLKLFRSYHFLLNHIHHQIEKDLD